MHMGFPCATLKEQSEQALEGALSQICTGTLPVVVLHYVGYGYAKNGAPEWMLDGLRRFLDRNPAARLAVVFHELYATSMPWRRAFWYSSRQQEIAKQLYALSSRALCTLEKNEHILRGWAPDKALDRIAVPSAIGEPQESPVPGWDSRAPRMVVFGLAASRMRAYRNAAKVDAFCRQLGIDEIVDVGPPLATLPAFNAARVVQRGALEPAEIARTLLEARYGYLYYSADNLAKSSIFAAYCAHGVVAVVAESSDRVMDELEMSVHYVSLRRPPAKDGTHRISENANRWYWTHGISAHAAWLDQVAYGS